MNLHELVAAYDSRREGSGRTELLAAMRDANGVEGASGLAASPDVGDRLLAARLMYLLPDQAHLPALVALLDDPFPEVVDAARWAMRVQRRTPEWHAAVVSLGPAHADSVTEWLAD